MLIGLDKMETDELSKELEELGIKPVKIQIIQIIQRYNDHANYILYYQKHTTDLKKVYSIKSINHTIIRWEPYRSGRRGTTQCRRCLQQGHGTRHCNLPPHCMYCAGDHLSEDCAAIEQAMNDIQLPMQGDGNEKTVNELNNFTPKCYNCQGSHIAISGDCPKKNEFSQLQRKISQKNRKSSRPNPPALSSSSFPELQRQQLRYAPSITEGSQQRVRQASNIQGGIQQSKPHSAWNNTGVPNLNYFPNVFNPKINVENDVFFPMLKLFPS